MYEIILIMSVYSVAPGDANLVGAVILVDDVYPRRERKPEGREPTGSATKLQILMKIPKLET